jgi:hypothetical protein
MDEKKLQLMKKMKSAESLRGQVLPDDAKFSDILAEYMEDESKPSNMDPADWKKAKDIAAGNYPKDIDVPFEKKVMKAEPGKITKMANEAYKKAADLLPKERMAKLAAKLGKRGLKAIPVLGTGLGLMDAAEAASEGNYKKAGMEALSAIDPTPLTDIYMAGQEVVDAMEDQEESPRPRNLKALQAAGLMADQPMAPSKRKMMQADPSLIKAGVMQEMPKNRMKKPQAKPLRKLAGEVDSPDIEEMDNVQNYEEYLKKKKRQLGYE